MEKVTNNIVIEGARIGFRNFSGKEGRFNPPGRRNFCIFLDQKDGIEFQNDGWNIRWLQPRDKNDDEQPYLPVAVSFDKIPPKIVMISSKGKTSLDEESVGILDWAEIANVDLIVRPYNWEVNGKSGVKAYLKSIYVTIVEDQFESKYLNVPDSASSAIIQEEDDDLPF